MTLMLYALFCETQFTHNTSSTTCKHSVSWIIDSGARNLNASSLKGFFQAILK